MGLNETVMDIIAEQRKSIGRYKKNIRDLESENKMLKVMLERERRMRVFLEENIGGELEVPNGLVLRGAQGGGAQT